MTNVSLGHYPTGSKWSFDSSVTRVFDDMLERSIPDFHNMRELCFYLGSRYVQENGVVIDLGCSRGGALAPFVDACDDSVSFVGCEVSQSMLEDARSRFQHDKRVDILDLDLRRSYPLYSANLTLSILTLVFTPIEYRQRIVKNVYEHTAPGGAFLLVEKILGQTAEMNDALVDSYYSMKARNGYSVEEIERKRLALEGVQVPVTARWNEQLLREAGFKHVECFWRSLNFAGWLAVRDE